MSKKKVMCEECGTQTAFVYMKLDPGRGKDRRKDFFLCGKCWSSGISEMKKEKGKK